MYHIFLYLNSPFAEKTLFRLQSPLISCIIHSRMEGYRSGHNGAVLKSECHFGNGHPKNSVFPRISGNQRKQNIGDFSPSFLSFSASLLRDDGLNIHSWRCTQVAEGSGLENRVANRRARSRKGAKTLGFRQRAGSGFPAYLRAILRQLNIVVTSRQGANIHGGLPKRS